MKDIIKMIVTDFFVICVSILFFTSVLNYFNGAEFLPINFPFEIMLTGILTAIPSMFFYFKNEPTKKQFYIRMFFHFCVIELIVMAEGALLGWYNDLPGAAVIFVTVILVYAVVVLYTIFQNLSTAKNINEALAEFQEQDENDNE